VQHPGFLADSRSAMPKAIIPLDCEGHRPIKYGINVSDYFV